MDEEIPDADVDDPMVDVEDVDEVRGTANCVHSSDSDLGNRTLEDEDNNVGQPVDDRKQAVPLAEKIPASFPPAQQPPPAYLNAAHPTSKESSSKSLPTSPTLPANSSAKSPANSPPACPQEKIELLNPGAASTEGLESINKLSANTQQELSLNDFVSGDFKDEEIARLAASEQINNVLLNPAAIPCEILPDETASAESQFESQTGEASSSQEPNPLSNR